MRGKALPQVPDDDDLPLSTFVSRAVTITALDVDRHELPPLPLHSADPRLTPPSPFTASSTTATDSPLTTPTRSKLPFVPAMYALSDRTPSPSIQSLSTSQDTRPGKSPRMKRSIFGLGKLSISSLLKTQKTSEDAQTQSLPYQRGYTAEQLGDFAEPVSTPRASTSLNSLSRKRSNARLLLEKGLGRVGSAVRKQSIGFGGDSRFRSEPSPSPPFTRNRNRVSVLGEGSTWETVERPMSMLFEDIDGDAGIGRPFNVEHDLHVNSDLEGLPAAWLDVLRGQGLTEADLLLIAVSKKAHTTPPRIPLFSPDTKGLQSPVTAPLRIRPKSRSPTPQQAVDAAAGCWTQHGTAPATPRAVRPAPHCSESVLLESSPKSPDRRPSEPHPFSNPGLAIMPPTPTPRKTRRLSDQLRLFRDLPIQASDDWAHDLLNGTWLTGVGSTSKPTNRLADDDAPLTMGHVLNQSIDLSPLDLLLRGDTMSYLDTSSSADGTATPTPTTSDHLEDAQDTDPEHTDTILVRAMAASPVFGFPPPPPPPPPKAHDRAHHLSFPLSVAPTTRPSSPVPRPSTQSRLSFSSFHYPVTFSALPFPAHRVPEAHLTLMDVPTSPVLSAEDTPLTPRTVMPIPIPVINGRSVTEDPQARTSLVPRTSIRSGESSQEVHEATVCMAYHQALGGLREGSEGNESPDEVSFALDLNPHEANWTKGR